MGANELTLDLDALRGEILLKTGQKFDRDDPLMAVILLIDHAVRANLIAAKEAAEACRAMIEKGPDGDAFGVMTASLSASITKQIQQVRRDLESGAAGDRAVMANRLDGIAKALDALAPKLDRIERRAAPTDGKDAAESVKELVSAVRFQVDILRTTSEQWTHTVTENLPRAISAEIRASEWRTAVKFSVIFVVLYIVRLLAVHLFGFPI